MGERLLCKQEVTGSNPVRYTIPHRSANSAMNEDGLEWAQVHVKKSVEGDLIGHRAFIYVMTPLDDESASFWGLDKVVAS